MTGVCECVCVCVCVFADGWAGGWFSRVYEWQYVGFHACLECSWGPEFRAILIGIWDLSAEAAEALHGSDAYVISYGFYQAPEVQLCPL